MKASMNAQMGRVTQTVCIASTALAWGTRAATRKRVLEISVARSVSTISMQDLTIPSATRVSSRKHRGAMAAGMAGTKGSATPSAVPGEVENCEYMRRNLKRCETHRREQGYRGPVSSPDADEQKRWQMRSLQSVSMWPAEKNKPTLRIDARLGDELGSVSVYEPCDAECHTSESQQEECSADAMARGVCDVEDKAAERWPERRDKGSKHPCRASPRPPLLPSLSLLIW